MVWNGSSFQGTTVDKHGLGSPSSLSPVTMQKFGIFPQFMACVSNSIDPT